MPDAVDASVEISGAPSMTMLDDSPQALDEVVQALWAYPRRERPISPD